MEAVLVWVMVADLDEVGDQDGVMEGDPPYPTNNKHEIDVTVLEVFAWVKPR